MGRLYLNVVVIGLILACPIAVTATDTAGKKQSASDEDLAKLIRSMENDELLAKMIRSDNPLTPEQIRMISELTRKRDEARHTINPNRIARKFLLRVGSGMKSPTIKIAPGNVGDIIFLDSTGEPWPIVEHSLGQSQWFNVPQSEAPESSHILRASALQHGAESNVSVSLKNLSIPINITLTEDSDTHYRTTVIKLDRRGPLAERLSVQSGQGGITVADPTLEKFMDRVPPIKAVHKTTEPSDGIDLWEYNGSFYLRTAHNLLSPEPDKVSKGQGGIRVYKLPADERILSMSIDGDQTYVDVKETTRLDKNMQQGEDK